MTAETADSVAWMGWQIRRVLHDYVRGPPGSTSCSSSTATWFPTAGSFLVMEVS